MVTPTEKVEDLLLKIESYKAEMKVLHNALDSLHTIRFREQEILDKARIILPNLYALALLHDGFKDGGFYTAYHLLVHEIATYIDAHNKMIGKNISEINNTAH